MSYSLPYHCPDPQGAEAALEEKWAALQAEGIVSSEAQLSQRSKLGKYIFSIFIYL
ncbi:MAG: hypothetical protein ACK5PQ_05020 [Alphaproteobacteria bacterium]